MGGICMLEAEFPSDPLFFLQIARDEGAYVFGQWWFGPGGWARTNQICSLIPLETSKCHSQLDANEDGVFVANGEVPFLRNAPARLAQVSIKTKEVRYQTKVMKASVAMPEE